MMILRFLTIGMSATLLYTRLFVLRPAAALDFMSVGDRDETSL